MLNSHVLDDGSISFSPPQSIFVFIRFLHLESSLFSLVLIFSSSCCFHEDTFHPSTLEECRFDIVDGMAYVEKVQLACRICNAHFPVQLSPNANPSCLSRVSSRRHGIPHACHIALPSGQSILCESLCVSSRHF